MFQAAGDGEGFDHWELLRRMVWTDCNGANLLSCQLSSTAVALNFFSYYDDDAQSDLFRVPLLLRAVFRCVDERVEVSRLRTIKDPPKAGGSCCLNGHRWRSG